MKWREWWIFKGTACHGDEKHYDPFADADLKITPEGFYDLVSPQDTIEGGIHVVEHAALDAANAKLAKTEAKLAKAVEGLVLVATMPTGPDSVIEKALNFPRECARQTLTEIEDL